MNILVTGATGNIGKCVIKYLCQTRENNIYAGVRNIINGKSQFSDFDIGYRMFDFEDLNSFDKALDSIDCVFLLRPPHIADVKKYFEPLLDVIAKKNINQIVFLSVQGVEKSKIIPHNKIEKSIIERGLKYVFLRPSYFMQNLTTTLYDDIKNYGEIVLPSGSAKFNWVDIENVAEIAAIAISDFNKYANTSIEITGNENLNFQSVIDLMHLELKSKVNYRSVNPIHYFFIRKKRGTDTNMIFVMIMLHFFPRFQKEPQISNSYFKITGKEPTTLRYFIKRESKLLLNADYRNA